MKIQKSLLLCGLVAVCSQAMASFEMMYIPSRSQNRIIRYDPVNRVFLGGMNAPGVSRVMAGNDQFGVVAVTPGSYRFNMYDGNPAGYMGASLATGSYNSFGLIVSATSLGFALTNIGTAAQSFQALTGPLGTGAGLGAQFFTAQPGFARFAADTGGIRLGGYSSSGAVSNTTLISTGLIGPTSNVILWTNNQNRQVASMAYYDNGLSRFRVAHVVQVSDSSYALFDNTLGAGAFVATQPVSLAPAHNGYYVVGANGASPTQTRIQQFDNDGIGFLYDDWTIAVDVSGTPSFGVGMVVAPEPGTMVALGLGAAALLRRRRRR